MANSAAKFDRCRLCFALLAGDEFVDVFSQEGSRMNLKSLILRLLFLDVRETDVYSTLICAECVANLHTNERYIKKVEKAKLLWQCRRSLKNYNLPKQANNTRPEANTAEAESTCSVEMNENKQMPSASNASTGNCEQFENDSVSSSDRDVEFDNEYVHVDSTTH